MKRKLILFAVSGLMAALLLNSCGPVIQYFNIDQRVPAEFPVDLTDKSISVFSSTDAIKDSASLDKERFTTDSLLMLNMALGLAEGLESNLSLDTGAIMVFNQTGTQRSQLDNPEYVRGLALNSSADMLFVIEYLDMGTMTIYKVASDGLPGSSDISYVSLPFTMEVGLYNGITGLPEFRREVADTIYWEVISRMDMKDEIIASRLYSSMYEISKKLGASFSSRFFDNWEPIERYLYNYESRPWLEAYRLSQEFKWKEAMDIWMTLTNEATPVKRASAAFNIAVALEMMDEYKLALEWIDYAAKNYPLEGIPGYKSLLETRVEKR